MEMAIQLAAEGGGKRRYRTVEERRRIVEGIHPGNHAVAWMDTVGKLHAQTAARRSCTGQFNGQQLLGCSRRSARAIPGTIIIQRVQCDTARTAKCLSLQSTLLKILYQALHFRLAPTTSLNNRSRIPHASTSTCNRTCEKCGFPRTDTLEQTPEAAYENLFTEFQTQFPNSFTRKPRGTSR